LGAAATTPTTSAATKEVYLPTTPPPAPIVNNKPSNHPHLHNIAAGSILNQDEATKTKKQIFRTNSYDAYDFPRHQGIPPSNGTAFRPIVNIRLSIHLRRHSIAAGSILNHIGAATTKEYIPSEQRRR